MEKKLTQLQKAHRLLQCSKNAWVTYGIGKEEKIVTGFDVTKVHCLRIIIGFIHCILAEVCGKYGKETARQYADIVIGRLQQWKLESWNDEIPFAED